MAAIAAAGSVSCVNPMYGKLHVRGENVENDKNKERLQQQMDFIVEIDKAENVVRQTYLADGGQGK